MTDTPALGGREPIGIELTAGEPLFWCACGRSQNQPYCDGSHAGTPFSPMRYVAEQDGEVWLCTCKLTSTPPFCDGSHNEAPETNE